MTNSQTLTGKVPPGPLSGQSALITGGGSGIGLAIASRLAADGATVVVAGRSLDRLRAAAASLAQGGLHIETMACDVTDEDSVREVCAHTNSLGRFTMCVANAGFGSAAPFHLTTLEEWSSVLATNLTGAFLTMKHAVVPMAAAGGGSIVAVSSIAGHKTHRMMTPYTVSKAGLEMLVQQVADELGSSGIRANAVRPGLVPTDATAGLLGSKEILADYLEQMPLGRVGSDSEIGELVRFLLGTESSWITGQCIGIDGGHTLRRGPNITPLLESLLGDAIRPAAPPKSV